VAKVEAANQHHQLHPHLLTKLTLAHHLTMHLKVLQALVELLKLQLLTMPQLKVKKLLLLSSQC
jgi:hypothetical protein